MIKGGASTGSMSARPHGISINSAIYGKAVKLIYGLTQAAPDLIWYNDWQSSNSPSNSRLADVTGASSKKKGSKKGNIKYYSAAVDMLLGHAPMLGVLTCWYNNQAFKVLPLSASGIVSGGQFSFTTTGGDSKTTTQITVPSSAPYEVQVSDFISNRWVRYTNGNYLQECSPDYTPGPGQYSIDATGLYKFNAAQAGLTLNVTYQKTNTGDAAVCAGVFAATIHEEFSTTIHDFGGPDPYVLSGHWDRPLWNTQFPVPGRVDSVAFHARYPYEFKHNISGSNVTVFVPDALEGKPITVYYGVPMINKSDGSHYSSTITPLALLNCEFEQQLGSGAEYANHPDQQIVQGWCSGIGSVRLDLGIANAIPNLNFEVIGAFTQWPNGDADVADVIEDIVTSGPVLYFDGAWTATASSDDGTNTADHAVDGDSTTFWRSATGTGSASDYPHTLELDFGTQITFGQLRWVAGYYDGYWDNPTAVSVYTSGDGTNWDHQADLTVDWQYSVYGPQFKGPWIMQLPSTVTARYVRLVVTDTWYGSKWFVPYQRTSCGCVEIQIPVLSIQHGANCNAFDNGGFLNPARPYGNGEILGDLTPLRNWCRANGISIACCQDSQRSAKDWLDELLLIANTAPVYSGDKVKLIPYDEVSSAGNGAYYTAPTAAGPITHLTDQDFGGGDESPIKITRKSRLSCDNVVSIEHVERSIDYSHLVTTDPEARSVTLFGPRKGGAMDASIIGNRPPSGSLSLLSIHSREVGQKTASIQTKCNAFGPNQYAFPLKAERFGLEAMNLVTLTDTRLGLYRVPVRLTSVKENPDRTLSCEAEQYIYGMHHPTVKETTTPSGTLVISNPSPGLVNDPIIFEYTAAMLGGPSNPQIGFIVSGADENYGGCIVHVSVDGGESYTPLNPCAKCTQGVLSAGLAIGSDPDTTHTLAVDLTESRGSMSSQIQVIADTFSDPCYVESATGYEIVCPTTAILTAPHKYNLTSYLRRGCLGTTIATHTTGQKFGVINSSVLKVDLPTEWLGKTLYFKFVAVNQAGGQQNQLSECTAYPFTPTSSGYPAILFQVNGE